MISKCADPDCTIPLGYSYTLETGSSFWIQADSSHDGIYTGVL